MRSSLRAIGLAILVAASASCGDVVRNGRSPVYLVVNSLQAAQGQAPGTLSGFLNSDVVRLVTTPAPCSTTTPCPTIFDDIGSAILRVSLKDIGTPSSPATPTANNDVTINRIHIVYRRSDGRNTPGIDVPYPFDAAASVTIPSTGTATLAFEIVRHVAKEESPLVQLRASASIINTITEVTFYGRDRVGNEVSATATIQINFGNFGDS